MYLRICTAAALALLSLAGAACGDSQASFRDVCEGGDDDYALGQRTGYPQGATLVVDPRFAPEATEAIRAAAQAWEAATDGRALFPVEISAAAPAEAQPIGHHRVLVAQCQASDAMVGGRLGLTSVGPTKGIGLVAPASGEAPRTFELWRMAAGHELGHVLGLAHASAECAPSLMAPTADGAVGYPEGCDVAAYDRL